MTFYFVMSGEFWFGDEGFYSNRKVPTFVKSGKDALLKLALKLFADFDISLISKLAKGDFHLLSDVKHCISNMEDFPSGEIFELGPWDLSPTAFGFVENQKIYPT